MELTNLRRNWRANIHNGYACESSDTVREAMKNFAKRAKKFKHLAHFYNYNVECLRELLESEKKVFRTPYWKPGFLGGKNV